MPAYKFYTLPRSAEPAVSERVLYNDNIAIRWALRFAGHTGLEVWSEGRFVGQVHAQGSAPQNTAPEGAPPVRHRPLEQKTPAGA